MKKHQSGNLTSISNFLETTQHTNVILTDVPPRYDLSDRSHINDEIIKYNKRVNKQIKRYGHVKTIKAITNTELFTRHGLHMNYKGREMLIKEIVGKMKENASRWKMNVICLPWKKELEATTNNYHTMPYKQSNEVTTLTRYNWQY